MPVIGVESMVTRAGLRYTRDYLAPGICSLIKPAAMEKLMSFRAKIHSHVTILNQSNFKKFLHLQLSNDIHVVGQLNMYELFKF